VIPRKRRPSEREKPVPISCWRSDNRDINKTLKIEGSEYEILGLDPTDRRSELIGMEFQADEDNINELLAVFGTSPFLPFPFLVNLVNFGEEV
jgi:hypothetical protein